MKTAIQYYDSILINLFKTIDEDIEKERKRIRCTQTILSCLKEKCADEDMEDIIDSIDFALETCFFKLDDLNGRVSYVEKQFAKMTIRQLAANLEKMEGKK